MPKFSFKIIEKDNQTNARTGVIFTEHGYFETPAFVPVGTQATVKSLDKRDLLNLGVQIFFVNTYHMILRPGLEVIKKFGGLHKFMSWDKPLMTDSAGFQIFSLGGSRRMKLVNAEVEPSLVKISEEGVIFRSHLDGSKHFFSPEESISAQAVLGADILIAFDECTFYPATYQYVREAMERTHRWALRCLEQSSKLKKNEQALYGVVQGGVFEDLRRESAKYISSLPFDGIAIGGVSVGESKEEMRSVLKWVIPCLPDQKPRHLLGVGEIDDIFALIEAGVDTFDCVMPTRLGRMGHVLTNVKCLPAGKAGKMENVKGEKFTTDITKAEYSKDKRPIDEECGCEVCQNYSRAYINHLFRAKELLAYRLATFHNIYFMEKLTEKIRQSIKNKKFLELKKKTV